MAFTSAFFFSKFAFAESISTAWIGLVKYNEEEENINLNNQFNSLDIVQCNEQESCTNNDHWKWISSNSHLTPEQLELFDDPKMHDDKPKRECAEIKWHPKSIIEARSCTVPHADGVICQIP